MWLSSFEVRGNPKATLHIHTPLLAGKMMRFVTAKVHCLYSAYERGLLYSHGLHFTALCTESVVMAE